MKTPRACFAAILLTALVSSVQAVEPAGATRARDAAVGADGELYVIREGTYGDLFPQWDGVDPSHRVLALEIVRPEGERERLLVPGTETSDVEDSASVLLENDSGTLFVLWQTMIRSIHSRLVLMGFQDGEWSEPIEISGSPFGWKSSPQLAITRDSFSVVEDDGGVLSFTRTVAHLVWWEEAPSGVAETYYTPVVFLDGRYTQWNPVYRLNELLPVEDGQLPLAPNPALAQAPSIRAGTNEQSVVIGFVESASGRLTSVDLELLPGEISFIAERIRAQITDLGRDLLPDEPAALGERVRAQITDLGNRLGLHPGVASYLATSAQGQVLETDSEEPVASLADKIRAQITDLGARITDRGFGLAEKSSLQVIEVSNDERSSELGAPPNLIRLSRAAVRPAPETGEGDHSVFLSRDGRHAVISWQDGDAVRFRESRGEGWSGIRQLRLDEDLSLSRAYQILKQRADERPSN